MLVSVMSSSISVLLPYWREIGQVLLEYSLQSSTFIGYICPNMAFVQALFEKDRIFLGFELKILIS